MAGASPEETRDAPEVAQPEVVQTHLEVVESPIVHSGVCHRPGMKAVRMQGDDEEDGWRAHLARERNDREASLATLRDELQAQSLHLDDRAKRVGERLVAALLEQARLEREDSVATLVTELEARLSKVAERPLEAVHERLEERHRETCSQLRAEIDARFREIEEGPVAAVLERERHERTASLAVLQDELDAKFSNGPQGLFAGGASALVAQERHQRDAALAALRSELETRMGQVTGLLERTLQEYQTSLARLREEVETRLSSTSVIGSQLHKEREDREAALSALRGELHLQLTQGGFASELAGHLQHEREDRETSLTALRGEIHGMFVRVAEQQQQLIGNAGELATQMQREREEREAAIAALQTELTTQVGKVAPASRDLETALGPCLKEERQAWEAKLAALRTEVMSQFQILRRALQAQDGLLGSKTDADGQPPKQRSRQVRSIVQEFEKLQARSPTNAMTATKSGGSPELARKFTGPLQQEDYSEPQLGKELTLEMAAQCMADAADTTSGQVSHLSSEQNTDPAKLEVMFDRFRQDITNSLRVLKLQMAQVESVSSTLDMDVRFLKEQGIPAGLAEETQPAKVGENQGNATIVPQTNRTDKLEALIDSVQAKAKTTKEPIVEKSNGNRRRTPSKESAVIPQQGGELAGPASDLNDCFARFRGELSQGELNLKNLPVGYKPEFNGQECFLVHQGSGVKVWSKPFQLSSPSDDDLLLYYYSDHESYCEICEASEVLGTLLEQALHENAIFGHGVYMTKQPPEYFGTKSAILVNFHTNASDESTQLRDIDSFGRKADFCIPFLVSRSSTKEVMKQATPEMTLGAGFTAQGEFVRPDRDIWVVTIDPVEEAIKQLVDTATSVRAQAARALRELATRSDGRAVAALLPRLGAERDMSVKAAIAGALGEVAQRGDPRVSMALQRCLEAKSVAPIVREAACLALGKVAVKGDKHATEALARCLDKDAESIVRASAAFVLGRLANKDDARAVEALTARFQSEVEDDRVSAIAGQALRRLGMEVEVEDEDASQCVLS